MFKTDEFDLEQIQRMIGGRIQGKESLPNESQKQLGLLSLAKQRLRGDQTMFHKFVKKYKQERGRRAI